MTPQFEILSFAENGRILHMNIENEIRVYLPDGHSDATVHVIAHYGPELSTLFWK